MGDITCANYPYLTAKACNVILEPFQKWLWTIYETGLEIKKKNITVEKSSQLAEAD